MKVSGSRVESWLERGQQWAGRTRGVVVERVADAVDQRPVMRRRDLPGLRTLPDWVRPSGVLSSPAQASAARRFARTIRLPRARTPVDAWSALGALGAALRLLPADDRRRVLVDVPPGLARRWFVALGFAVEHPATAATTTATAAHPLIACRVHPDGATVDTIDDILLAAALSLAPRGLLVTTLPVGAGAGQAGRAEIRGIVAHAAELGLELVGDIDGLLGTDLTRAVTQTGGPGGASGERPAGLIRLSFVRR